MGISCDSQGQHSTPRRHGDDWQKRLYKSLANCFRHSSDVCNQKNALTLYALCSTYNLNVNVLVQNIPPHIPSTIPFLGHAVSFGTSPVEFLLAAYEKVSCYELMTSCQRLFSPNFDLFVGCCEQSANCFKSFAVEIVNCVFLGDVSADVTEHTEAVSAEIMLVPVLL